MMHWRKGKGNEKLKTTMGDILVLSLSLSMFEGRRNVFKSCKTMYFKIVLLLGKAPPDWSIWLCFLLLPLLLELGLLGTNRCWHLCHGYRRRWPWLSSRCRLLLLLLALVPQLSLLLVDVHGKNWPLRVTPVLTSSVYHRCIVQSQLAHISSEVHHGRSESSLN